MRKKKITEYPSKWSRLKLNMEEISQIDFFCATAVISLGALIGKLKLEQYLLTILFETFFSSLNYFICYFTLGGIDTGGSIYVFTFGAIFGFCVSFTMSLDPRFKENLIRNQNKKSNYYSNIISAIGSLFIWLYFPSFNTARIHWNHNKNKEVVEIMRYRGIINTYMSLFGSTITTFCISALLTQEKFRMQHILRSSYVGGVIIAGSCTFCPYPWCAIILGMVGGGISVYFSHLAKESKLGPKVPPNPFSYQCVNDFIDAIRMSDTMDILYCFGVPGIIGGIFSAIFLGSFEHKPWNNIELNDLFYYDRTAGAQGGIQFGVLVITIVFAVFSAILVGSLNRCFQFYERDLLFNDNSCFEENNEGIFPQYTKKNFLSSSENQLNNDEQDGVEVEVNNNNIVNNNIE
jgi:ammonium transporter Rh